ncbi:MAG: class I SAM-dependent methyltransferase [Patescibacteria group bacterium]|nr:class I SAM-dependent methyltransferase [Patescibacteria group bacterium]MDD4611074.1 class I SAM-dependent methyltransferase [Patescibacteria group bacterium]
MNNQISIFSLFKFWFFKKDPIFECLMKEKKVLDMGCGEGNLLRKDSRLIYGLDINKTLVEKMQAEGLQIKLGSVTAIPYEDQSFDIAHCRNIIEHLDPQDAYQMFLEMKRVLKSGGLIILHTPMVKTVWNTFGHIKPYPPMAIKKLFRQISLESFDSVSGLKIEKIIYYGCWGGNKFSFLISTLLAQFIPYFRGAYLMIIKK